MLSQCPQCKTVFRVRPEQLEAANGKVRCSRCQTVFIASEHPYRSKVEAVSPTPSAQTTEPQAPRSSSDRLRSSHPFSWPEVRQRGQPQVPPPSAPTTTLSRETTPQPEAPVPEREQTTPPQNDASPLDSNTTPETQESEISALFPESPSQQEPSGAEPEQPAPEAPGAETYEASAPGSDDDAWIKYLEPEEPATGTEDAPQPPEEEEPVKEEEPPLWMKYIYGDQETSEETEPTKEAPDSPPAEAETQQAATNYDLFADQEEPESDTETSSEHGTGAYEVTADGASQNEYDSDLPGDLGDAGTAEAARQKEGLDTTPSPVPARTESEDETEASSLGTLEDWFSEEGRSLAGTYGEPLSDRDDTAEIVSGVQGLDEEPGESAQASPDLWLDEESEQLDETVGDSEERTEESEPASLDLWFDEETESLDATAGDSEEASDEPAPESPEVWFDEETESLDEAADGSEETPGESAPTSPDLWFDEETESLDEAAGDNKETPDESAPESPDLWFDEEAESLEEVIDDSKEASTGGTEPEDDIDLFSPDAAQSGFDLFDTEEPAAAESTVGEERSGTADDPYLDLFAEPPLSGDEAAPREAESDEQSGETGLETPPPPPEAESPSQAETLEAAGAEQAESPDTAAAPTLSAAPAEPAAEPQPRGGYSLPPQLGQASRRSSARLLGWGLGILLLAGGLGLQYLYYQRLNLAQSATWRPVLEQMCAVTGCQLPPRRDLQKVQLLDHLMQNHPRYPDSLLITATLINRADFTQPFPVVEVVLTDLQQKVVASRRFGPEQYLVGDAAQQRFIPDTEVPLMLEVVDPGEEAVGFEFRFY